MKKYKIDDLTMENIATYMDDNIRKKVHLKQAPCTNEHFSCCILRRVAIKTG